MKMIGTENVVSVMLFNLKMSEGELQLFEIAVSQMLEKLTREEIEDATGFTAKGVRDIHQELLSIITSHCLPEFLPNRYKK